MFEVIRSAFCLFKVQTDATVLIPLIARESIGTMDKLSYFRKSFTSASYIEDKL